MQVTDNWQLQLLRINKAIKARDRNRHIDLCRHYKNEAEVMLEENWRVRLEELSFQSQERRGMTRTGSRASLYRVRVAFSCYAPTSVGRG